MRGIIAKSTTLNRGGILLPYVSAFAHLRHRLVSRRFVAIVLAPIYGGIASCVFAAFFLALHNRDLLSMSWLLFWSALACLPAGAVAGFLGALWLATVVRNPTRLSLLIHGTVVGAVFSLPMLIFVATQFWLTVAIGAAVGFSYSLFFFEFFVAQPFPQN